MSPTKGAKAKQAMLEAAVILLDEKGYFGTSTSEILARSKAPRGSLYYHFPGGKDEIVMAAIQAVGGEINELLTQAFAHADSVEDAISSLYAFFSQRLVESEYTCGCPISAVAMECSGKDSEIGKACADVYRSWRAILNQYLQTQGYPPKDALHIATALFSLLEGALLLARSTCDLTPLHIARETSSKLIPSSIQ